MNNSVNFYLSNISRSPLSNLHKALLRLPLYYSVRLQRSSTALNLLFHRCHMLSFLIRLRESWLERHLEDMTLLSHPILEIHKIVASFWIFLLKGWMNWLGWNWLFITHRTSHRLWREDREKTLWAAILSVIYQRDYAGFVWHWITGMRKHQMEVKCSVLTNKQCFGQWTQYISNEVATIPSIWVIFLHHAPCLHWLCQRLSHTQMLLVQCRERMLLRPCSWGGRRGNVSWCLQRCCLRPWRRAGRHQSPSSHPGPAHLSLGVVLARSTPWALFWLEGKCGQGLLLEHEGWGASCKHLNCRDTAHGVSTCHSALQWLPRK